MTKKIYALAALIITSLVLYVYLISEFYAVQYGTATGDSICSLSASFNCEAVAASKYAHLFGNLPNAMLGLMLNLLMLVALFGLINESGSKDKKWFHFFGGLATLNFLASVLMGSIALFAMDVYCLFCMCLYAISTIIFTIFLVLFKYRPSIQPMVSILKSQVFLALLIAVPALSVLGHKIVKNEYSPAAQEKEINASIKNWKNKEAIALTGAKPLFVLNPGAKVKIAEFADFLCSHCATASEILENFIKVHTDVEFSFYAYPLDPNCNKNFEGDQKGPGFSCTLAAGVYCAQKQGLGVQLHHDIFENQNYYRKIAMTKNNEGLVSQMESLLTSINHKQADITAWKACLPLDTTNDALIASATLGKKANVQGTPTIYVNNKKLNGGAHYLILKAAHRASN